MVKCVVSGCSNCLEVKGLFNRPQKRFFNLPRDPARVKVWLAALRETEATQDNHIICEDHFLPEHITPRGISDDAIPLMPPDLDGPLGSAMATEEEEEEEEEEAGASASPHATGGDDSQPPPQHQQDDSVEHQSVATTDIMEHQSVATTDIMEHQSVATTDIMEHQSVATTDIMEHQSVATTDSVEHQAVATTDSMEHQSVATTDSMEHQSVATTDSVEHQSVATTDSMELQPVATTDSVEHQSVATTESVDLQPVVTTDSVDLQPVVTTDSVDLQSVATTDSMEHQPEVTTDSVDLQPVVTTDSMEHQPDVTTDSVDLQSVATTDSMEHQPEVTTDSVDLQPVATTDSLELKPVATTDSLELKPVATTDSLELKPVATTDSVDHQSIATTDTMEHQSVTTTDSCDVTPKLPDPQTHQKTLIDNPASKTELSFILLTRRLMELLSTAPDGVLDLTQAAARLKACRRRVYDVTSVLGAFKLVRRRAPNKIQWIAESPVSSYLGKSDHAVQEELGNLKVVEETLDVLIKTCAQQLFDMTDDTHNTGSAYVTHEDISHIPVFQGQTVLVVKAPEETKLEVPTPTEDSIQVHLKAGKGPITVLTCEMGRAGEAPPPGSGENAAGCFLHVEESRIKTHPLHTETQQKVVQSA